MATIIEQEPLYATMPVGQDIMFAVSNINIVANQVRVKFIAEVHISKATPPNPSTSTHLVGTFKTTPNNAGIGMFNLSSVIESFVKADNIASVFSSYKNTTSTTTLQIPLHLIDTYSPSEGVMRYLAIQFKVEYLNTTTNQIVEDSSTANSDSFKIFNGYLKHTDKLAIYSGSNPLFGFGYDVSNFQLSSSNDRFLTNAPVEQYATVEDYGTLSFLDPNNNIEYIKLSYFDAEGGTLGTEDVATNISVSSDVRYHYLYFGCFPANLRRDGSTTFAGLVAAGTVVHYTVRAYNAADEPMTREYTINIKCPDLRGYSPIRLAWLNQWGAWDYYTFSKKSVRSLSTKGSTYTQQSGTWNESQYRVRGYKGGEKSFRVNATERIKMNTDFVNESESEWFEELINSPEVYIVEGYQSDNAYPMLNTYVIPVRLTTSSYIRKTVANDRLMQYTFEVEKSKTLRTQAV